MAARTRIAYIAGREGRLDDVAQRLLRLLEATEQGDLRAVDAIVPLVYEELRALAAYHLRRERPDHTLQPTALVHEVYLRLIEQREVGWKGRVHFMRIAAQQIRRVLVDHARARKRDKRGGDRVRVTLTDGVAAAPDRQVDMMALDEALDRLDRNSKEDRAIVELKYFGGLTEAEIAAALGITDRTVRRRWSFARAWLFRELGERPSPA